MIQKLEDVFTSAIRLCLAILSFTFFSILYSHPSHAALECRHVLNQKFELPKIPNKMPVIIDRMQAYGTTQIMSVERCAAFAGACGLATVTVGIEALERFFGRSPTANDVLSKEAMSRIGLLSSVTSRSNNGLYFSEILGLARFSLADRGLDSSVSLRSESVNELSDLSLAANEMLILLTFAGTSGHAVLITEQRGMIVRAYDPNTSRIEEYRLTLTPNGKVRLVSTSNPVGPTSVLDAQHSFRLSPESKKLSPPLIKPQYVVNLERALDNLSKL